MIYWSVWTNGRPRFRSTMLQAMIATIRWTGFAVSPAVIRREPVLRSPMARRISLTIRSTRICFNTSVPHQVAKSRLCPTSRGGVLPHSDLRFCAKIPQLTAVATSIGRIRDVVRRVRCANWVGCSASFGVRTLRPDAEVKESNSAARCRSYNFSSGWSRCGPTSTRTS